MTTKIGIISHLHNPNFESLKKAVEILKDESIDALVLNGDIYESKLESPYMINGFADFLKYLREQDFMTFIQPGHSETVSGSKYEAILGFNSSSVIYVPRAKQRAFKVGDYHLLFLPGARISDGDPSRNGFFLTKSYQTGYYEWGPDSNFSSLGILSDNWREGTRFAIFNIEDIRTYAKKISDIEKAVLFSHISPRFSTDKAIDVSYRPLNNLLSLPLNYGDIDLKEIIEDTGINKVITGHYHDSVHRAHDGKEEPIEAGEWSKELFFMASYMNQNKFGLIELDGDKIRYYKLKL